jgi:hypothetical protein
MFLRAFMDVPAREELAAAWKAALTAQQTATTETAKAYYAISSQAGKEAEAFEKGVSLLTAGYLIYLNAEGSLSANLTAWAKDAKKQKIAKEPLKDYATVLEVTKAGWQAFGAVNGKGSTP